MSDGHIRVRSWLEFKLLVREKKPTSLVYVLEQNALSPNKELSTLRIILMHDKRYYLFLDFPKGQYLRETGIPLHRDKNGLWNLDEDEVKVILRKEFEKENIEIFLSGRLSSQSNILFIHCSYSVPHENFGYNCNDCTTSTSS